MQYGFGPGISCEDTLLNTHNGTINSLNSLNSLSCKYHFYTDMFDIVEHINLFKNIALCDKRLGTKTKWMVHI